MDSRQRLKRCFFHQELDRPGVFIRTGYPAGDETYDEVRAYVEAKTELKRSFTASRFESQPPTRQWQEPHSSEYARRITVIATPAGELRTTRLVSLTGQPGMTEKYPLAGPDDAETYLSLPMPDYQGDGEEFLALDRQLAGRGIVDVSLGHCPGGYVAELFGSETFAMMSVTDRPVLHALLERHQAVMLNRLKYALSLGLGPYFSLAGEEFCVPPLHGPADFRDFIVRYDKPIIDAIHDAGGRVHIHCHGSISRIFQDFIDMGTDVLHPVEPPPMGDLPARAAKEMARGRMTIEGNIQIADMYERTPREIEDQTRRLIADAFDDRRGLIVCPTASLYQRGKGRQCFQNVKAMVETVLAVTSTAARPSRT